jgi:uncharacterized protein (DUF302 family)
VLFVDFIYEVSTNKPFEEVVKSIEEKTKANNFRVLHIHDVQTTLSEKNFSIEPLKIIEVCNAKYAYTALQIEITVSLLMPCRLNVYTLKGETKISTVKPTALVNMFGKPELKDFAVEVEKTLEMIINQAK